jgi:flagellar basal-body rod protein FlgF
MGKMENSAYIALSGQSALKRKMGVIANNLANMNTTAFKGETMMFVEHLVKSKGGSSFIPQKLTYARDVAQYQNLAEGPFKNTGNPLDIAIHGDGYFVMDTPDGERYTRNGHLSLSNDGKLVDLNNQAILSDAGTPFFFGPEDKDIEITTDGLISTSNGQIGKIKIVRFDTPQNLQKRAGGLYFSEDPPVDVTNPTILQNSLESSNINAMSEITKMINVQRAYDSVRTFIDKEDQRQKKMIQALTPR